MSRTAITFRTFLLFMWAAFSACESGKSDVRLSNDGPVFGDGGPFSLSAYLDVNPDRTVHGIRLTWSIACCEVERYHVERAVSKDGPFAKIADYPAESPEDPQALFTHTTYLDTDGLVTGTSYYYRVRATSLGAFTKYSKVQGTENVVFNRGPELPATIDGQTSSVLARLSLNNGVANGIELSWGVWWADVDIHRIERALGPEGPFEEIATLSDRPEGPYDWADRVPALGGRAGFRHTDTSDLIEGETYYYRISIIRGEEEDPPSKVVDVQYVSVPPPQLLQVVPRLSDDLEKAAIFVDFGYLNSDATIHIEFKSSTDEVFQRVASLQGNSDWLHAPVDLSSERVLAYRLQAEVNGILSGYSLEKSVSLGNRSCVSPELDEEHCPAFCNLGCEDGQCAASTCPDICSGGCEDNTCTVLCNGNECRDQILMCPEGMDCKFLCLGFLSCADSTLVCGSEDACELECDDCSADTLLCGSGPCHTRCPSFSVDKVDCGSSTDCSVAPSCVATEIVREEGASSVRSCPPECTGGCDGDVCIFDGQQGSGLRMDRFECPQGRPCQIRCTEESECPSQIVCPTDASCEVACTGPNRCRNTTVYAFDPAQTDLWCRSGGTEPNCPEITFECVEKPVLREPPKRGVGTELSCIGSQADSNTCPGQCSGGCAGGVCIIDCQGEKACAKQVIRCPPGMPCEFRCKDCFKSTLICSPEEECRLVAADTTVAATLICGNGPCTTTCADYDAPSLVDCSGSSHCSVEESCIGTTITRSRTPTSTSGCPPVCNGGCDNGVCFVNCTDEGTTTGCINESFDCPVGLSCSLLCEPLRCKDVKLTCQDGQECSTHCGAGRWPKELDEIEIEVPSSPPTPISGDGIQLLGQSQPLTCALHEEMCGGMAIERKPPSGSPEDVCPSLCTGGCQDGVCKIACDGTTACRDTVIHCPEGRPCKVECAGTGACQESYLSCIPGQPCQVECTGAGSCVEATIVGYNPSLTQVTCHDDDNCADVSYVCAGP